MADLVTPKGRTMKNLAGDPSGLANEVTRMKNVATTIEQLVDLLGRIKDGHSSQSEKVDEIRDGAGEAKKALAEAKDLYNKTGWALGEYQTQLSTSVYNASTSYQSASDFLWQVNTAENAYDTAHARYNQLLHGDPPTPAPGATPEQQQADATKAANDLEDARVEMVNAQNTMTSRQQTLLDYKKTWDTAKDDLDTAAETARGRIHDAVESSPAKDSTWDNIAGVLDALSDLIGWVILVCVIVALIFTGPIALAFLLAATILTVVNLALHTALLIGGKGSWVDVALDLVGLIPFGKLATTSGGLLARLAATGRGAIDGLKITKIWGARGLVNSAVAQNAISGSGRFWQSWADGANAIANGAKGNFFTALGQGGSRELARLTEILEALPGRNVDARAAINAALDAAGGSSTPDAVHFVASQVGGDIKLGHDIATGDDWVASQVSDMFQADPSSNDLKTRILEPTMIGDKPVSDNPYD